MVVVGNGVLYVLWIPASAGMTLAGGNDGLFAGNRTGRHSRGRGNLIGAAGIIPIFSNPSHPSSKACEGSACFVLLWVPADAGASADGTSIQGIWNDGCQLFGC